VARRQHLFPAGPRTHDEQVEKKKSKNTTEKRKGGMEHGVHPDFTTSHRVAGPAGEKKREKEPPRKKKEGAKVFQE